MEPNTQQGCRLKIKGLAVECGKPFSFGSDARNRTQDMQINSLLLYQLSYAGIKREMKIINGLTDMDRYPLTLHIFFYPLAAVMSNRHYSYASMHD